MPARLQQRIDTLAATFEKPAATGNATQATRAAATGAIATTFVCGVDESAPAVSLTWEHIVLAGDSRLYAPCPSGTHDATHREMRDAALLADGLRSNDPIVRRFAVQELAASPRPIRFAAIPCLWGGSETPASTCFTGLRSGISISG